MAGEEEDPGRPERSDEPSSPPAGSFAALRMTALRSFLAPCFTFKYSYIPSRPPSRPYPLSRYPPKPAAASNMLVHLIQTVPALSRGATSGARLIFSLHPLAASP